MQMWVPAGQTVKQAVVITNLSAQTLTSLSFDAGSFSNLTVVNESSCSSLVQNASCTAIFTYAPSAAESQTGNMDVTFNLNGTPYGSILPTTLAASTSQVNIVLESVTATTANSTPSNFLSGGQTSSSDPYQYYNLGNSLQLTLTYKNIGTATATQVAVVQDLPIGYTTTANTCGGTGGTITLAANATCNLTLQSMLPVEVGGLTYSGSLNLSVPVITYYDSSESQNYIRNTLTVPTSGLSTIYVSQQPSLVSNVQVGQGSIVVFGTTSYYQYPITFANNASGSMTSGINLAIDAVPGGVWSTSASTLGTSGGSTACGGLAGGSSCTLYLTVAVTPTYTAPSETFNYTSPTTSANVQGSNNTSTPPYLGVSYQYSGSSVSAAYATVQSLFSATAAESAQTVADPLVKQLLVDGNYLYAIGTNDVYSSAITPWSAVGNYTAPVIGTTGGLAAFSSGLIGGSYGPAAVTIASTESAYVIESNSTALDIYGISSGAFTFESRVVLPTGGNPLVSIAVDGSGNVFVAESKVLYSCGSTLAICNTVTLPAGFTTTTNYKSMNVAYTNGNVVINSVVAYPQSTVPNSYAYYATDTSGTVGSWTSFGGSFNINYANASTINYNTIYGQVNNVYYMSGIYVYSYSSGGSTYYDYYGNGIAYAISGSGSTSVANSNASLLSSSATQFLSSFYSFLQQ